MSEDIKLIELIKSFILSFDDISRFADAGLSDNLHAVFGREVQNPGIRVASEDDKLTVSLDIIVYFGTNIPRLCYDIQTKLKSHLEQMTGTEVKAVNIRIEGIDKRVE